MEVLIDWCAGLDVRKKTVVLDNGQPFDLLLVNPAHIKNVPGRKTDVNDATWSGQLFECGLLRGGFVSPVEIRELREVTRYRRRFTEEHARETQRLQKVLEDANVKLSSVASDVLGVTGRLILDALCDGERDPDLLAEMAKRKPRAKIGDLRQCVPGRFNDHHGAMVTEIVAHVDYLTAAIQRLDARVEDTMVPFKAARVLLETIPDIKQRNTEIILAEIGVDMTRFATGASRIMGWCLPRQQRVRRQTPLHPHTLRRSVAAISARRSRLIRSSNQGLLSRRQVLADRETTWPATRTDGHCPHDVDHHLAHARRRHRLHRDRRRLPRQQRQPA